MKSIAKWLAFPLLTASVCSNAITLGSGPVSHGKQSAAVCMVQNIGNSSFYINSVDIYRSDTGGSAVPLSQSVNDCFSTYGGTLPPKKSCYAASLISTIGQYDCIANVTGTASQVRGNFDLRDGSTSGGGVLLVVPLR
jgi:hypothetical protein